MSLLGFDPNKYRTTTAAQTKPQEQGRFGDVVDSFQAGAASGLGGIFDFIGADGIAKSLYNIANDQYGQMSSRGQEAMGKQMFQTNAQGETELGEGMTDLDTWLLQMANVAGQFVPTAVPGAGAAGLATKALSLGSKGAKVAQAVGMGATGGSAATGQAMDQARQEVLKMPDQVLADSELFKQTFLNIDAQSPELDDVSKWNQAKSQLAEQVASEVRSDPKALLANFAASAIGDPVIGRALTGVRLAKSGALRSALAGGITEGATEATQAGVSQYAVDNVLSQIDQRDPMAGVKLAALNEGIIGAGFGAGAGGIGGIANRNVVDREPAKNPAADPIRESNPTVAGAMDADAQQAADRKADIESMAQASQAQQSQQPNYDQPTAARRAGMGDTMQAGRFGDEAIARDNAMKGRSFPTVPEQFNKSPLTQAMDSVQELTDQRREGEWLPPEGEGRSPVTGLLSAPFIDGENLNRQRTRDTMAAQPTNLIGQSDTIFANDGRARQAAQQFADTTARQTATQPKQITDKGIIFAPDTFSPKSQGINVKSNNTPFASAKEALISKGARAAKREGAEVESVKLDKGFGWRVVPKTEPETKEGRNNAPMDTTSTTGAGNINARSAGTRPVSELQRPSAEQVSDSSKTPRANGTEDIPVRAEQQTTPAALTNAEPAQDLAGDKIDNEWTAFAPETGTLNIPRSEMPQIKAEHRGAMVNFMKARGVDHTTEEVSADSLKPTQAEFSPAKVKKALGFEGGDRSILVSSDNHVLDGHHQWLTKREKGEQIKVIRLNAPIKELITLAREFPSSETQAGATPTVEQAEAKTAKPNAPEPKQTADNTADTPAILRTSKTKWVQAEIKKQGFKKGSPGYDDAVSKLNDSYETEIDKALAESSFETYQQFNSDTPESINRMAYAELRKEFGLDDSKSTNAKLDKPTPTKPNSKPVPEFELTEPSAPITDFGEKIGGARKDVWGGFSEAIKDQQNTKELPLSKSWPEPDYQELADNGTDREALALIAAMRAQIPPKPRMTYKVERWANNVNELKTMALSLIDGSLSVEQVKKAMSTKSSDLSGIANAAPVLAKADLGLLKGVANYRIQSGRFTVFGGKEYPQGKNLYFISRDGRTMYDGASETLSEVQALLLKIINADQQSGAAGPKAKQSKIDVYTDRYTKQAFLGWKGAKGVLRIKTFESVPAARDYLKQNRDEVESTLARMKETPNERRVENAARIGPERFSGNVTPAIFADTFGFRGVEFGNYVEQVKRQKDLNQAYDALMDLAEVIDIPPKAISLNGELGLAFGARGKGGSLGGGLTAAAHYEPGNIVINLTKKAGAGSLAHEWYHALDNYFSRKRGDASSFISERPYPLMNKGVREEVLEAFKGIKKAIYQSELVSRAKALDSRRSTAYWSTDIELGARAFESFVIAELERKGMTNDYLANIVSEEYWNAAEALGLEDGSTYPYPNQIEASSINAAYQSLFETIDVREGDSGNIELFSKASKGANRGARQFTQSEAQRAVDDVMKRLSGAAGIRVNLFTSQDEFLSRFNVPAMAMEGQTIYGAYDDRRNSAYLILDNFKSIDELRSTLVHEVLAHGGLHTVIGAQKYQQFINKLNSSRSRKEFKELWARIDKDYAGASDAVKAEEVFANFVQNQPERGTAKAWWFELNKWLRRQLEGLGIIKANITRNEMEDMMQAIVRGFDKRKLRIYKAQKLLERHSKERQRRGMGDIRFNKGARSFSFRDYTVSPDGVRYYGKSSSSNDSEYKATYFVDDFAGNKIELKDVYELDVKADNYGRIVITDQANNYFQLTISVNEIFDKPTMSPYLEVLSTTDNPKIHGRGSVTRAYLEGLRIAQSYGLGWNSDTILSDASVNMYERLTRMGIPFELGDYSSSYEVSAEALSKVDIDSIIDSMGTGPRKDVKKTDIRFSMAFEDDTRTAKQKLGLEEEAEQTLKEKITENYRNTADTLKQSSFWSRLNEGIFDGLHGIKKAEEAAGITDPNKMGYVSARLASGLSDVLHGVFHYGAPMWKDGIIQRKADTKGLLEVFGMLPDGELNNWLAWMGANRAKQLKAEGRENNLSQSDIDELLALADGKEKLFEEVRAEYNKINSAVLDVAQGAGLISAEQRAGFDEQYYVPFFREQDVDPEMQDIASMVVAPFTKKGIAGQSAKIKELKGGKQSTKDLLENIILRQSTMLDAALKNKAMLEVTDNLSGTQFMTEVDSPEFAKLTQKELNSIQRVKVMRNGQAVAYAVTDPALLRGLIAVNDVGSQALFNRMGRSAKRFLTTGVTLSPDFIFKNFVRDAAHAWMINKDDFKLGTDSIKGLKKAFKEDEAYRDLIFSGAAFQGGYIHGADPEAAAQQIRRALAKKGLAKGQIDSYMDSLVTSGSKLFEKYRNLSDKVENANRLSTYEAGLAAGKSRRQAAFEAKDLMDYSLKGNFALISTMIDFLPFFNARLQGMYKLARASAAGENDKVLKVLSANLAMKGLKVAAFSLALAAMNDDDDRYKELPDWDKDANWHFWIGDDHFRIPKPFELGVVFGTLPERLFGFGTGSQTGSDLGRAVGNAVFNTMALNPIPQIALPVVEVMTNKSFFKGTAIEGMGDENRMPGDRYNAYTSDTAREVGQLLNVSPKKIEHLVNGYSGTLGGYVLAMSDMMARQMLGKEKPETPISRYPIIKAFYGGDDPKGSTYYQNEFYKALDAANQAYGSYKRAAEEQDSSRMMAVLEDNRDKLGVRIALNRVQRQVSALSKQAEMVNNSSMSPSEKREKLDAITRQKNAIYQSAYVGFNLREW